jgi:hypothetical protein
MILCKGEAWEEWPNSTARRGSVLQGWERKNIISPGATDKRMGERERQQRHKVNDDNGQPRIKGLPLRDEDHTPAIIFCVPLLISPIMHAYYFKADCIRRVDEEELSGRSEWRSSAAPQVFNACVTMCLIRPLGIDLRCFPSLRPNRESA